MSTTSSATIEDILSALNNNAAQLQELGALKLGVFGSRVRGDAQPDSDVDILVTLSRPSYDDYMNIKFYLEDILGCRVDLVTEDGLKPLVRPYVMGEVVYAERS